jgi:hypothetical protein
MCAHARVCLCASSYLSAAFSLMTATFLICLAESAYLHKRREESEVGEVSEASEESEVNEVNEESEEVNGVDLV